MTSSSSPTEVSGVTPGITEPETGDNDSQEYKPLIFSEAEFKEKCRVEVMQKFGVSEIVDGVDKVVDAARLSTTSSADVSPAEEVVDNLQAVLSDPRYRRELEICETSWKSYQALISKDA